MSSQSQNAEKDGVFNGLVQNLVDLKIWKVKPFSVVSIADIINALGERIAKWKESGQKSLLYLQALTKISENTILDLNSSYNIDVR